MQISASPASRAAVLSIACLFLFPALVVGHAAAEGCPGCPAMVDAPGSYGDAIAYRSGVLAASGLDLVFVDGADATTLRSGGELARHLTRGAGDVFYAEVFDKRSPILARYDDATAPYKPVAPFFDPLETAPDGALYGREFPGGFSRMAPDGTVTRLPVSLTSLAFTPSGDAYTNLGWGIDRVDLATGERTRIYTRQSSLAGLDADAAGRLYVTERGALLRIDPQTGTVEALAHAPLAERVVVAQGRVYAIHSDSGNTLRLAYVDVPDAAPVQKADGPQAPPLPDLVVTSVQEREGAAWDPLGVPLAGTRVVDVTVTNLGAAAAIGRTYVGIADRSPSCLSDCSATWSENVDLEPGGSQVVSLAWSTFGKLGARRIEVTQWSWDRDIFEEESRSSVEYESYVGPI